MKGFLLECNTFSWLCIESSTKLCKKIQSEKYCGNISISIEVTLLEDFCDKQHIKPTYVHKNTTRNALFQLFLLMKASRISKLYFNTVSISLDCRSNVRYLFHILVQYLRIRMVVLSNIDVLQHYMYCWFWIMNIILPFDTVLDHQVTTSRSIINK